MPYHDKLSKRFDNKLSKRFDNKSCEQRDVCYEVPGVVHIELLFQPLAWSV